MFTGLVEDVGTVSRADRRSDALVLAIRPARMAVAELAIGESVCHDGCCLTVTDIGRDSYTVLAGAETLARTTLGGARIGTKLKVERVTRALEEIRNGKMVILVDDEDRENEGDLVFAAELVMPEHINFMATHARGLICLAMDDSLIDRLELPMMVRDNQASLGTAFTVSIEARHGVSTGISARDRATTVRAAIADDTGPHKIVSPGHVFPLRARKGGVLVRTGQTEGSVDLARLAGLKPAGVICEIMREDGEMARRAELEDFAQKHGLMLLSVADMIAYRLLRERIVHRTGTG